MGKEGTKNWGSGDPHPPVDVLKVDCDEDGVGGYDAVDCLRYLVATRARTVTQRKLRGGSPAEAPEEFSRLP